MNVSETTFAQPAPTETTVILNRLVEFIREYVVVTPTQAATVALWVAHSHVVASAHFSPYLAISSAEMRSGKTTMMKVLDLLVARPWRVVTPSEAVVYRKIDRDRPTLLLDEFDTIFSERSDYEPLRALLNAGNEPGTVVPRCAGANRDELVDYAVYCAKALAGIGSLPSTVADRAIEIRMKRKAPGEAVSRFLRRDVADRAEPLHQSLVAWGEQYEDLLVDARPSLPNELDDRAADAWEALLAVADIAGAEWSTRARTAALELSGSRTDEESHGVRLLRDILTVFESRPSVDRIGTADLIESLAHFEESPWGGWWWDYGDGKPKPTAPRRLAKLLHAYDISSESVRVDEWTGKGYSREKFEDAWARFIPSEEPPQASHPSHAEGEHNGKPHGNADVADVADVTAHRKMGGCRDCPLPLVCEAGSCFRAKKKAVQS